MFQILTKIRGKLIVGLAAVLLVGQAHAITLNMTYFNEGDPVPHDENPPWDPDGTILKAHFQAAKTIWEYLLPGGGSYDFDFEWDDDISGLGLTTGSITGAFIEIHPSPITSNGTPVSWFADPTPNDNTEFNAGTQRLFSQLSASDQSFYFPGTAPPGALEVNFQGTGIADSPALNTRSSSGQNLPGTMTPVDANNGYDLLSTIVHEIGHVLGISGVEPGDYNIDPQHVGGLNDVLVLEGGDGHLGGGPVPAGSTNIVPGFLMCNSCGVPGLRRYATATDVLVIAEDQGITVVQLARVGRVSSGVWSDSTAWIAGDVPDATQDVYVSHGGTVTLDADAEAKNLNIFSGANSVAVGSRQLSLKGTVANGVYTNGTLTFDGAALAVGAGGTIVANNIVGNPASLTTTAGSMVRFNQFTRGTSSATATSFNGSVGIGYATGISNSPAITFNPNPIMTWTIAENLKIGDESDATLVVNASTWNVGGNLSVGSGSSHLTIQSGGTMTVGGNVEVSGYSLGFSDVTVDEGGTLDVTGQVIARSYGRVTYKTGTLAADETFDIQGGVTSVDYIPPTPPPRFVSSAGGSLTIEGTANVVGSTFNVDGGTGNGAPGGSVTFKTGSTASNAQIRTKGGHKGGTSPYLAGLETPGNGGLVRFEGNASAWQATIENEGVSEYFGGTGGRAIFADNSTARDAMIHNHGATHVNGGGGVTQFRNSSTADAAMITNHADGTYYVFDTLGATGFFDSSNAGTATIENEGSPSQSKMPGRTEFRGNSSAANATIHNRGFLTVGDLAGRTLFYDSATAGNATINMYGGYSSDGRTEFHNTSTAANARIFLNNVPTIAGRPDNGGNVLFYDNSTAGQSQITLRQNGSASYVHFYNNATAANAQIITETGTANAGTITFWDSSTAANANISLGEGGVMNFYSQSTAANATISLAHRAQVSFSGGSAGQAQITAAGGSTYTAGSQAVINFVGTSTAANSTITVNGATATLASPATVQITGGANAGNATLIANSGSNGGAGGIILFNGAANGSTARLVANAGTLVDFFSQAIYNDISFGSIEGAGTFYLRGAHVITGNRNTSTTVSGPIVDTLVYPTYTGGRLTKVGTGTLTLAGTNTYTGLTTVNAGTVSVTGSITGGAVVNSGGTLKGTGTIGGGVTINDGGVFEPGTSPGTLTIGGLTMSLSSSLNFELGDPLRDHIVLTNNGNVALAGILNIILLDGYTPTLGQSFSLFEGAVGSITGAFDSIIAPTFNGLTFDIVQDANSLALQVGNAPFLAGDYNGNGAVDAADYVLWRKNNNTATTLLNDSTPGTDQSDFNLWQPTSAKPPAQVRVPLAPPVLPAAPSPSPRVFR